MLKPGMFISDRYEIIDNVGSGGMADVYKARDQRLNRFVAIKVLKPEYSSDKSFVNKFRGEAQSAAGLSHPNIVNVYDVGDDSGLHYIVMELVEGITLKRFIERKGKLEVKEAIGIAIQIAQGMEAAHDNHIIHRDIKPQNIIISRDGKVKVTDFGIAKATNSNTITSNAMGSVHYLSPEQARGGYSDEKSDIYSLGVTIYEMLSGKVPFAGDNTVSVALLHIQGEAMPLRELDPNIPVSIDKIVQKCMQKRPERRYHSASELIMDLKRAISNPDGDFVKIPAFVANDSPTINISDDLGKIKNSTFIDEGIRDVKNDQTSRVNDDDDEELDTVDSKVEKFFAVGSIVAIVILGLIIITAVVWLLFLRNKDNIVNDPGADASNTPTVEASITPTPGVTADASDVYKFPDVKGYTLADATNVINKLDPEALITPQEEYSDTVDKGLVISQYPNAGNDAAKGTPVVLKISAGPQSVAVPNVDGQTLDNAKQKLADYNLTKVKVKYEESTSVPEGQVIKTDPAKDEMATSQDTITIYISQAPANTQVKVPDLRGKTENEAKKTLSDLGLVLGNVTPDSSETYPSGQIFYQNTTAGLPVDKGTAIDVMVSTGPKSTQTSTNVSYRGDLTIDIDPFNYVGDGEAEIILEMTQPGFEPSVIYQGATSTSDFPLPVPDIVGDSADDGIVVMYVDGKAFKLPDETEPHQWVVKFKAVEE